MFRPNKARSWSINRPKILEREFPHYVQTHRIIIANALHARIGYEIISTSPQECDEDCPLVDNVHVIMMSWLGTFFQDTPATEA